MVLDSSGMELLLCTCGLRVPLAVARICVRGKVPSLTLYAVGLIGLETVRKSKSKGTLAILVARGSRMIFILDPDRKAHLRKQTDRD